ncbi:MAG: alpha/beta fold hydrolase [Hyphomicrobium sp.]|uniref:alpha/beta fold hydrolase n=1 Tax=Hyphomicrobium sp. TaxID=82 RepID=UPI0039E45E45
MDLPFDVPYELFPVEHKFLEIDGARLHYVDEGQGEALLLLHGNPTWSFLYRKIIRVLRSNFRCVALDYPGYGMSSAPPGYGFTPREHSAIVEKFVETLGLKDLTVMVQDWGGPIGLGFAGRRPELIRRLIIGNTFAWPLDTDPRIQRFSSLMGGTIGRSLTYVFNFVPRVFFARGFAKKPNPDVMRMYLVPWRKRRRRKPAVIAPKNLISASEYLSEVEAGLKNIADRPTLIVWGTKDFAFQEPYRRRFEAYLPRHETVVLKEASHFVQEDSGDEIARAFEKFAARSN